MSLNRPREFQQMAFAVPIFSKSFWAAKPKNRYDYRHYLHHSLHVPSMKNNVVRRILEKLKIFCFDAWLLDIWNQVEEKFNLSRNWSLKTRWFSESTLNMMPSLVCQEEFSFEFLMNMNLCVVIFRVLNKIMALFISFH